MDCFRFSLPCQFTTSRFISHHTWRFCTPERATIAIAVISTLTFKPFSIFFYPLNRSFSIFFFFTFLPCSLCPTLQFVPGKFYLCSAASLCQMLGQCKQHKRWDINQGCDLWHQQPAPVYCWAAGPPGIQRWLH